MGRDLSFDEAMIASVARCAFRVFTKDKPVKRGYKLWVTADAVTRCCFQADLCHGDRDKEPGCDAGVHANL